MCPESSLAEFQPQILVLCCRQALAADADLEPELANPGAPNARTVLLPCTGKIEIHQLLKHLAQGVDGIEVIGCAERDCQFLDGNTRFEKRLARARDLLALAGMQPDRIGLDHGLGLTPAQVLELARGRAAAVRPLGSNPMKTEQTQ